jgi:hypothetical protein
MANDKRSGYEYGYELGKMLRVMLAEVIAKAIYDAIVEATLRRIADGMIAETKAKQLPTGPAVYQKPEQARTFVEPVDLENMPDDEFAKFMQEIGYGRAE